MGISKLMFVLIILVILFVQLVQPFSKGRVPVEEFMCLFFLLIICLIIVLCVIDSHSQRNGCLGGISRLWCFLLFIPKSREFQIYSTRNIVYFWE